MRGIGHGLIGLILTLAALSASPAWADGKDCPLIGTLDNFVPRDVPLWTTYAAYDFRATQGNGDASVTKIGSARRTAASSPPTMRQ